LIDIIISNQIKETRFMGLPYYGNYGHRSMMKHLKTEPQLINFTS